MAVELYEYQKKYIDTMPKKGIMSADTGCFAKGTRVLTPTGYVAIENLKPNDLVATFENGVIEYNEIEFTERTCDKPKPMIQFSYEKKTGNNTTITATYDHPFYNGKKYYPLYQLTWGELEASQRVQLELLCKQYGQNFNYKVERGLSSKDNATWERQNWTPENSDEWENSQGSSSGGTNLDTKSEELSIYQSSRRKSEEQQHQKFRMGNAKNEQPTRLENGANESFITESNQGENKINTSTKSRNDKVVEHEYDWSSEEGQQDKKPTIEGIVGELPRNNLLNNANYFTEAIKITGVKIKPAEPYYAIGVKNVHTYIVETLPVHNTGKSFMSLAHYQKHALGRPLLILAPASKIRTGDWERDIKLFFGENTPFEWEVMSYTKFAYKNRQTGKSEAVERYAKIKDVAIIADECHALKSPSSNIGKEMYKLVKNNDYFCGLSATALPNGWIDGINYFRMFNKVRNITEFKKRYCQFFMINGTIPKLIGYWREDELKQYWNEISRPLSKKDALDLPDRTFIGVDFMKSGEYAKIRITRELDGELLDNPSKLTSALRQSLTTKDKIDYLDTIIEGTDENIVIFYNYISEREAIMKMLAKSHKDRRLIRQDGEIHAIPKKSEWDKVKRSITLAHYKSGGTGVEMTYATVVVYFSPTYSYAEYQQSIGRVYRNGQTAKTTFYCFRTPGTIEEDVYKSLKEKKDFSSKQWVEEM